MTATTRGVESTRYLSTEAAETARAAIAEADGNEVFFLGRVGAEGLVERVEVHCRGHNHAVPALLQVGKPGDVVLHNHPSGDLRPSQPDLTLASHYGQGAVGFLIIDNLASRVYAVVEPRREGPPSFDPKDVDAAFGVEGLRTQLPDWEPRPGQITMARGVTRAQAERRHFIVEAGTGTGKSLAYLVPSALRAVKTGERVLVSTYTKHLQAQLLQKDVPAAGRLVPGLKVALLKGRGNYLCRRKLEERLRDLGPSSDAAESQFLVTLRDWAELSPEGSISDLPFIPAEDQWESVQSDSEQTLSVRCSHFNRCFFYESRRRAASSHIMLVNHHLLLADRAVRDDGSASGILPRYDHVVIDEAHHLEDVATDWAGEEVGLFRLQRQLGRVRPRTGRGGVLGRAKRPIEELLGKDLAAGKDPHVIDVIVAIDELATAIDRVRFDLRLHWEDLISQVRPRIALSPGEAPLTGSTAGGGSLRLKDDLADTDPAFFAALQAHVQAAISDLGSVQRHVELLLNARDELEEPLQLRLRQPSLELASFARRLGDGITALGHVLVPAPRRCRWVELRRMTDGGWDLRLCVRPVEVGEDLRRMLWDGVASSVLTSATLSVDGTFEHLAKRVGLWGDGEIDPKVDPAILPSPFDFRRQVLFGVASDMPEPGAPGWDDLFADAVAATVRAARGRTFVLLTSWKAMKNAAQAVAARLAGDFAVLQQGEQPMDQLVSRFRATPRAVLFGIDSLWEGVDVQGEALSCVILARLPFRVPTEPLQQARIELVEARDGDAFAEISVPQAVVKFKQGFGRLIRHRDDRGAVLVFDVRLVRKRYGSRFFGSLPTELRPRVQPWAKLVDEVAVLLGGPRVENGPLEEKS